MSGQPQIDVLLQSPQRFSKVFALSRRAPQGNQGSSALQHVPMDLLLEPDEIAKRLKEAGVRA
jgi:DNA-directed RNA polymerase subunit K/omega